MPDPSDFQAKYTNPQTIAQQYQEQSAGLSDEERRNLLKSATDELDSLNKAISVKRQLANEEKNLQRFVSERLAAEKELDNLLSKRGNTKAYFEEAKALGVMREDAERLLRARQQEGKEAVKTLPTYQKMANELHKARSAGTMPAGGGSGDTGNTINNAMIGNRLGGARGAVAGGMMSQGVGVFVKDFLSSLAPGGMKTSGVLQEHFPNLPIGITKGLGALGGAGGYVTAGILAYNQLQRRIGDPLRSAELAGQQVGGGIGEGLHQRRRAAEMSWNPFDAISNQIANQIVQGTVGQGFRGRQADQVEDAAKSIYIKTGMSIEDILTLTTLGIRNMGLSVKETENEVKSFHDNLQDSNMSLQEYTQRVTQTASSIAAQGGGVHSIQEAQALTKAFPKPFTQESVAALTNNPLMQARQAAMLGVPIPSLYSQTEPQDRLRALQTIFQERARIASAPQIAVFRKLHGRDPTPAELTHLQAGWMSQNDPYFQGIPADQIEAELKKINRGSGPAAQATNIERNEAYRRDYNKVVRGARGVSGTDVKGISDQELAGAQTGARMFRGEIVPFTPRNKEELAYWEKYGVNPQDLKAHKIGVRGETHYLDPSQEKAWMRVRQKSLEGLSGSNVDPRDLRDLAKHISDPHYDWSKHLQEMRHRNSKTKGMAVDYQTADGQTLWIKLDPKTKSWYLEKDDKAKANNAGDGRRNDSRPYMPGKTATDRSRENYNG